MNIQTEMKLRKKIKLKQNELPDYIGDFIYISETSKSLATCLEYLKDLTLFYEYLIDSRRFKKDSMKAISFSDLNQLTERDFIDFLNHLTHYKKTYTSEAGKVVTQDYYNRAEGKNRKIATLRVFFNYLFQHEEIDKDVTQKIVMRTTKKAKIKSRLNDEEIERFFNTILEDLNIESEHAKVFSKKLKYRDYVIVLILAYCGIRVSELAQLDLGDIYREEKSLVVTRKGGNEQAIPIPNAIFNIVLDYVDGREKLTDVKKEDKEALFISLQGNRIAPKTIRQMLEKYRVRSGISMKITPHVFRRTFGTNHYNEYHDMYLTALVLGHSSAETTRKFYADPDEERVKRSMQNFSYGETETPDEESERMKRISEKLGISLQELTEI